MGAIAKRAFKLTARLIAILFAAAGLYMMAGIAASLIPANGDWREPEDGVLIYVHDNGVHTGLVLPRENAFADWNDLVSDADLADPRYAADHLLFGWGDRQFYLETPTWGDLSLSTGIAALFGSDSTLVHVDHVRDPAAAHDMRPLRVSPEEYAAIAAAIRAQFALDAQGRSQPIRGYGPGDVFYEAHGRYSPIRTCNEWTGSILRDAGVRIGQWTPFNFGVMRWFEAPSG